jgi:hypothetical protein
VRGDRAHAGPAQGASADFIRLNDKGQIEGLFWSESIQFRFNMSSRVQVRIHD